jgi:hypothetical protein
MIVIVPGFNPHSRYYAWAAEHLVATSNSDSARQEQP